MKYWINVVSKDHLQRGIGGGFMQANHGKPHMLRRLAKGDMVVFYSPKTAYEDGEPLQSFTAIAQVADDEPYQMAVSSDFKPWRRKAVFHECEEASIRPLIDKLEFIEDTSRWGYKFRFGMFEISEQDYRIITQAMKFEG